MDQLGCFHDEFDITAASLAKDIVARGNDMLTEFKERLIVVLCIVMYGSLRAFIWSISTACDLSMYHVIYQCVM